VNFDWTVSISDVVLFGGGIIAFLKIGLAVRDTMRDVVRAVGSEDPPSGLLGDVYHIKTEQQQHREWLIRGGFDRDRHA
jgi:hypothetical protein